MAKVVQKATGAFKELGVEVDQVEIKIDRSSFKLKWLERVQLGVAYPLALLSPGSCITCVIFKIVILILAIIGLFSII